jgi:hypothetical protein
MKLTYPNGNSEIVKLTDYADVFGTTSCPQGNCTVRSAEMTPDGFGGTYGAPNILSQNRRRRLGSLVSESYHRKLDTIEQSAIFNPIYCIHETDSFMFNIPDYEHYPQYMKNSVINSNEQFDYGAFIDLE